MADQRTKQRAVRAEMLRQRQTSRGLLTHAQEYRAAAVLIAESVGYDHITNGLADTKYHNPFYFLCGHSIELAAKAPLLLHRDHQELKELGHSLVACLREMESFFPSYQSQYNEHREIIALLDISYSAKEFEYRITGAASWPVPAELLYVTEEFCLISSEILKARAL